MGCIIQINNESEFSVFVVYFIYDRIRRNIKEGEDNMYAYALAFGALCGFLIGIYIDQMTWGLLIGATAGLIIGLIYDNRKAKQNT